MKPNPGSQEAIKQGCKCPVLDNCHGEGFILDGKTVFWYQSGCPLHDEETFKKFAAQDEIESRSERIDQEKLRRGK